MDVSILQAQQTHSREKKKNRKKKKNSTDWGG